MDNMKAGFIHLLLTMKIPISWEAMLMQVKFALTKILLLPSRIINTFMIQPTKPGYLYSLS